MPRFFASSAFIANAYVLLAGDMLSHTMPLAPSTSLILLYAASAESNLSVILLNTASAVPVYSQYTSIWPFSSAMRTAALPMPALRSGV